MINAAQAIPDGAADDNEVRVTTRTDVAGRVVVEVSDTGAGMSEAVRARVFESLLHDQAEGSGDGPRPVHLPPYRPQLGGRD